MGDSDELEWLSEASAIVIDNGSASIKAGFSAEDAPRVVESTIVARTNQRIYSYKNI